jgi:hypothetical protein
MREPYKEQFPKGSSVRVISRIGLETFAQNWKYHHKLQPEQMEYAEATANVKEVSFYHGGDVLYVLENVPGIWHEFCLESAVQPPA